MQWIGALQTSLQSIVRGWPVGMSAVQWLSTPTVVMSAGAFPVKHRWWQWPVDVDADGNKKINLAVNKMNFLEKIVEDGAKKL